MIEEGHGVSTDVAMTDVGAKFNSDLILGDRIGSLMGSSDGDVVMTGVGAMVTSDLTLGDQVCSLVGVTIKHPQRKHNPLRNY